MFLKIKFIKNILTFGFILLLVSCGGGKSSSLPDNPPPVKPELLSIVAGDSTATISWKKLNGLKYNLYSTNDGGLTFDLLEKNLIVSPHTIINLKNNRNYNFALTAENGNGESGYTKAIEAVTTLTNVNDISLGTLKIYDSNKVLISQLTHACVVKVDQSLWCWGNNRDGQIGNGKDGINLYESPVEISVQDPLNLNEKIKWSTVSAGGTRTCAISVTEDLYCWGNIFFGKLTRESVLTPQLMTFNNTISSTAWKEISVGQGHICGIQGAKNTIYCWGDNSLGQALPKNNKPLIPIAKNIGLYPTEWKNVSVGEKHTCAIGIVVNADDFLYCWGNVNNGTNKSIIISPTNDLGSSYGNWISISSGSDHTCGIAELNNEKILYCWGENQFDQAVPDATYGALTNKPTIISSNVTPNPTGVTKNDITKVEWSSVSASELSTCAIQILTKGDSSIDEDIICWGNN